MQDLDRHELRTAWLARRVALVMGLDAAEAAAIGEAARSHDSGMRFVSPAVWRNPALLGRPERREIEMHAVLGGAALMSPQPERPDRPRLAVQVALLHHEWWNGNGYPFGLAGRAVPFAARVTAVADVFDALVHDRRDRQAWAREHAMAYLLKERGLQFDPLCAEAMHLVASGLPEDWEIAAQQEGVSAAGDDAGPLHQQCSPVAGLASRMMPA